MNIPPSALDSLKGILDGQQPSRHNSLMATGVTISSFPPGVFTDNEKYLLDNGAVVVANAPDGSVYNIKKDGVNYRIIVVTAGTNLPSPISAGSPPPAPADPAADAAAAAAAKAKAAAEEKMLSTSYTPFTSLANKVLKEFHKNSKPLPIETANKK